MAKYDVTHIWFNHPLPVRCDHTNSATALTPDINKFGAVWQAEFNTDTRMFKVKLRHKGSWETYGVAAEAVRLFKLGGVKGKVMPGPLPAAA